MSGGAGGAISALMKARPLRNESRVIPRARSASATQPMLRLVLVLGKSSALITRGLVERGSGGGPFTCAPSPAHSTCGY